MKTIKKIAHFGCSLVAALLASGLPSLAFAEPASGYYTASTLDGKNGRELELALKAIVYTHTKIEYKNLWTAYETTDVAPSDSVPSGISRTDMVYDMYAWMAEYPKYYGLDDHQQTGGINREHCVPNSWWGGESGNAIAYTDLHHLVPSDGAANSAKANYPIGEYASGMTLAWPIDDKSGNTNSSDYYNTYYSRKDNCEHTAAGVCKAQASHAWKVSDTSSYGGAEEVFEPADEYKGDFARMYLYVVCAYEGELTWSTNYMFTTGDDGYTSILSWAKDLLLKWHRQDPVSDKERARNDAVYSLQANRNPFIDYPELVEYIWGNKTSESFSLANAVCSYSDEYKSGSASSDDDDDEIGTEVDGQYTITFACMEAGKSDGATTLTTTADIISDGSDYMTVSGEPAYIYKGVYGYGIKGGKSSSGQGDLVLATTDAGNVKPTKITINACYYGSDNMDLKVYLNGSATANVLDLTSSLTNFDIEMDGKTKLTSIELQGYQATKSRFYVNSITVYFDPQTLTTPTELAATDVTGSSAVLTWSAVENATSYVVKYKASDASSWTTVSPAPTTNTSTLDGLDFETTYSWQVIAKSPSVGYKSSEAAISSFTTLQAPTYAVTFYSNGEVFSSASYKEGAEVVFPTENPISDKSEYTFVGWSETEIAETDDAPTLVSSCTMGTEAKVFHAVFAIMTQDIIGTASQTWDMTSSQSDWTASNCVTYFTKPYGMKEANAYVVNAAISGFATYAPYATGDLKISVSSFRNGETETVLTISLVDSEGSEIGTGKTIIPDNASAVSGATSQAVIFAASEFESAAGYKIQCTTFGKNTLITATGYSFDYEQKFYSNYTTYAVDERTATSIEIADVEMTVDGSLTFSPTISDESLPVVYTIKSGEECISITDGVITATHVGTAVVTAAIEETETYKGASTDFTVTVTTTAGTYSIVPNDDFWGTSYGGQIKGVSKNSLTLTATKYGIDFTVNNGTSTNGYVTTNHTRFYNGYTLQVDAPDGYELTGIVFTPTKSSNWAGETAANVGTMSDSKTWTGSASSVTITFAGTCQCQGITVTYVALPAYSEASLTFAAVAGSAYYATFSNAEGVTFFPADPASGQTVAVHQIGLEGQTLILGSLSASTASIGNASVAGYYVPANTGVLLKLDLDGSESKSVTYYTVSNKSVTALEGNLLMPGMGALTTGDGCLFYKLAYGNYADKTDLGFYWGADEGAAFKCKSGTAYLAVPQSAAASVRGFSFDDLSAGAVSGLKAIEPTHDETLLIRNLSGQRLVRVTQPGLYIVNGKTRFIKD